MSSTVRPSFQAGVRGRTRSTTRVSPQTGGLEWSRLRSLHTVAKPTRGGSNLGRTEALTLQSRRRYERVGDASWLEPSPMMASTPTPATPRTTKSRPDLPQELGIQRGCGHDEHGRRHEQQADETGGTGCPRRSATTVATEPTSVANAPTAAEIIQGQLCNSLDPSGIGIRDETNNPTARRPRSTSRSGRSGYETAWDRRSRGHPLLSQGPPRTLKRRSRTAAPSRPTGPGGAAGPAKAAAGTVSACRPGRSHPPIRPHLISGVL